MVILKRLRVFQLTTKEKKNEEEHDRNTAHHETDYLLLNAHNRSGHPEPLHGHICFFGLPSFASTLPISLKAFASLSFQVR